MIADLKPYPQYKESGLPWLGRVPGHWSVRRIKTVLRETDCRSADGLGTLLSLTRVRGLIPHEDMTNKMHSARTLVGYKRYSSGQLVMNRMQAWSGMFGAGQINGLVSPDYAVFDVLGGHAIKLVLPRLKAPDLVAQFALESKGIGSGFNRLYTDRFGSIRISLPPLEEQAAIVLFLDWANGRLERAIRAKRKVIALVNEQKQAIIHRAVTRGLDHSVPLKPSGIPWLGEIPAHWEVVALGRLCTARCDGPFGSGLKSMHYTDSGVRVIRLQNIGNGEFQDRGEAFISAKHYATLGDHGVDEGDLLVAGLGDEKIPAGRACIAPPLLGPAMVKADCFRFRLIAGRTVPTFLSNHLSATARGATSCLSTGATRLRINLSATAARSVALPPVVEQQNIVDFIGKANAPLHAAIARLAREIELLREYRTRLASDLVTGKLDAREVAARLPEEAAHDAAESDRDLSDEIEPNDEEAA